MNTEFKSMVQLMRSKDPTNRDLGFELAKGAFPEFWAWFEDKVTEILIKAQTNKELMYEFQYEEVLNEYAPKKYNLGSLYYLTFNFWGDIWAHIIRNGYTHYCPLQMCECGARTYCPTSGAVPHLIENCPMLPF